MCDVTNFYAKCKNGVSVALTTSQMRAAESAAIESGSVTGLELMERAGQGVVDALLMHWPDLSAQPGRAVVLCGPGNNGGDGFVIARLLRGLGWDVDVFLFGDPASLPPDARANYERWQQIGATRLWADCAPQQWQAGAAPTPIVIDAVFGTGLSRPPPDAVAEVLAAAGHGRSVAVDVPSILSADTGCCLAGPSWPQPAARLTVTFHTSEPGHFLADGPDHCGSLQVVDIGLPPAGAGGLHLVAPPFAGVMKRAGHKFDHGHALVLTGDFGRTGAARLAARAALRAGAGVVTVGAPEAAMMECATQLTAIMLRRCADGTALSGMLQDGRINALCLGPGMGLDTRAAGLLAVALASGRKLVLDADALTLIAKDPRMMHALHPGCVLTPHAGEFARLFPQIAERLAGQADQGPPFSKVDATRQAAAKAGCTVLFKGHDTVIADPSGATFISSAAYDRAAPWLATAGSGDVLAGLVTGLLARGLAPVDAASAAAWLHVEAARNFGPGLIAEDLPDALPGVLRALDGFVRQEQAKGR